MRIDADKGDTGFIVTLNGKTIDHCIIADTKNGYIKKLKFPLSVKDGEIETIEQFGVVEIKKDNKGIGK